MKNLFPILLVGIIAIAGGQAAKTEPTTPIKSDTSPSDACNQCLSDDAVESLKSEIEALKLRIHEYETSAGNATDEQMVVDLDDEPDPAMVLYERAMEYRNSGGRRWNYSGSDLVGHLIREHGYDRESLERQSADALVWIHSMTHEQPAAQRTGGHWETRRYQVCGSGGCRFVNRKVWVND